MEENANGSLRQKKQQDQSVVRQGWEHSAYKPAGLPGSSEKALPPEHGSGKFGLREPDISPSDGVAGRPILPRLQSPETGAEPGGGK